MAKAILVIGRCVSCGHVLSAVGDHGHAQIDCAGLQLEYMFGMLWTCKGQATVV